MFSKLTDWFTKTNAGRSTSHALIAFATVLIPLLAFTSVAALKASFFAALPAAAATLFRLAAPNVPPSYVPPPAAVTPPVAITSTVLPAATTNLQDATLTVAAAPTVPQDDPVPPAAPPAP